MPARRLTLAAAIGLTAVLVTGCSGSSSSALSTSGTITATEVSVSAEVAGKVVQVLVEEGRKVKQGEPIAQLDAAPLQLQAQQARAALEAAQARLAEARAGARPAQIRQADAQAAQAAAALAGAQKNYDAIKQLYDQGAATKAQFDAATTQLQTARAQSDAARAQADLVRQGVTQQTMEQLQAAVSQAQAAADLAQLNLDRATLKAPVDGTVVRRLAEPGTLVAPGAAVATIANLDDLWLRVYVPENQLNLVKLGMPVAVSADAYPGKTFKAEVSYISDTAEFTPRNVQTKQERSTTVYAVKLRLLDGLDGQLKSGMPADVTFQATEGVTK